MKYSKMFFWQNILSWVPISIFHPKNHFYKLQVSQRPVWIKNQISIYEKSWFEQAVLLLNQLETQTKFP